MASYVNHGGKEGLMSSRWILFFTGMVVSFSCHIQARTVSTHVIGRDGKVVGEAQLQVREKGSILRIKMWQIPPGWHALHFHERADCSDPGAGFLKSGGHWRSGNNQHGVANHAGFHMGDLANVYAHKVVFTENMNSKNKVQVQVEQIIPWITVHNLTGSVAIVMHAEADDYSSDPTGNAGARIACGVLMFNDGE